MNAEYIDRIATDIRQEKATAFRTYRQLLFKDHLTDADQDQLRTAIATLQKTPEQFKSDAQVIARVKQLAEEIAEETSESAEVAQQAATIELEEHREETRQWIEERNRVELRLRNDRDTIVDRILKARIQKTNELRRIEQEHAALLCK